MINSILRKATRKDNEKLNILASPTHEAYQTCLANVNANFYLFQQQGIKTWDSTYRPLPKNHTLLTPGVGLPPNVEFDLVLSQEKFGQFPALSQLAMMLHVPLVNLEHTLPAPNWPIEHVQHMRTMRGNVNVFISEYSREKWGWGEDEALVCHHGIDTKLFKPNNVKKEKVILSVVNDWVNRNVFCNFEGWQRITKDLPVKPVGKTPGLSEPAKDVKELVSFYQNSQVFLNTSTISPVPTALMEAMSCGAACVSTATCMIPTIIENGVNGFISNDEKELRAYCELLLKDDDLAKKLGENARKTILERFSVEKFVDNWNKIFNDAAQIKVFCQ